VPTRPSPHSAPVQLDLADKLKAALDGSEAVRHFNARFINYWNNSQPKRSKLILL
jgi:hypothetical protein